MLKYLLLLVSLGMAISASAACTAISVGPSNPAVGQTVYISASGCNSACYSTCLGQHARWSVSCQGSFVIGGVTYYGNTIVSGTGFNAVFNSNTSVTVTFSTNGNCNSPCNTTVSKSFTVGTPPPPAITRPSTSFVGADLIATWETAGANRSDLPSTLECINVHSRTDIVSPFRDGYRVNVRNLNTLINTPRTSTTATIYFQAARYYFDKSETININQNNVILGGEGATRTRFIIDAISTSASAEAVNFISINSRKNVGVTCLNISSASAFNSSFLHNRDDNDKFNNRSIIELRSSNHCWISGVQVLRGYGSTVSILGGSHNEVTNCFFYDHWTLGGSSGTQGYSVNIANSDNNLIENNKMGLSRHNIIVQGRGGNAENSALESDLSSGNVIAYNYLYEGLAKNALETLHHPWNITFHGGGANRKNLVEGNVCVDKIGVDRVKGTNGSKNVFYRNLSKTQIEVERGGSCLNTGQIHLGNIVYKRALIDRYKINGNNHLAKANSKCNSSGGSCNTGSFDVGNKCGLIILSGNTRNTPLSGGERLGQSCYLTAVPSFLTSLPVTNPDNVIPAKYYTGAPALGCYTCANVILRKVIINGPGDDKDPKEPGEGAMKKLDAENKASTTKLDNLENVTVVAFPNPTADQVTIRIENASVSSNVVFQLFDVSGKLITTSKVLLKDKNSFDYDLSAIRAGIYIGSIIDNGKTYSVKIMKQ